MTKTLAVALEEKLMNYLFKEEKKEEAKQATSAGSFIETIEKLMGLAKDNQCDTITIFCGTRCPLTQKSCEDAYHKKLNILTQILNLSIQKEGLDKLKAIYAPGTILLHEKETPDTSINKSHLDLLKISTALKNNDIIYVAMDHEGQYPDSTLRGLHDHYQKNIDQVPKNILLKTCILDTYYEKLHFEEMSDIQRRIPLENFRKEISLYKTKSWWYLCFCCLFNYLDISTRSRTMLALEKLLAENQTATSITQEQIKAAIATESKWWFSRSRRLGLFAGNAKYKKNGSATDEVIEKLSLYFK